MCNNVGNFVKKGLEPKNILTGGVLLSSPKNIKASHYAIRDDLRDKGVIPAKKPDPVDPEQERLAAQATATQNANMRNMMMRKAMRENSLLTGGGQRGTLGV